LNSAIVKAALIIALGNVASRVLGVVREQVIASLFGATYATDAFTAASRVPIAIYDLLIGGMISAALVPVFSGYFNSSDRKSLGILAGTLLSIILLVMTVVVGLLIILAPQLMDVLARGYTEETKLLSIKLVRLILPCLFFLGVSGISTALLYAQKRFFLPALAAAIYNVGMLVAALLLHDVLDVASLVVGVLFGTFLQMAAQAPGLIQLAKYLRFNLFYPGVKDVVILYLPVAIGLLVSAVSIAIDTNLASRTGEGNLAAMRFATTIVQLPLGLVATAISFAVLPTLSSQAPAQIEDIEDARSIGTRPVGNEETETLRRLSLSAQEQAYNPSDILPASPEVLYKDHMEEFRNTLLFGLKTVLLLILPATIGLVVLRYPLIRLLFERGAFDEFATERTALAFLAYSPGLPAAALDQVLVYAFYAMKKTITPVVVGVIGVGVYLVVGVSLLGPVGMPGLALANSAQWVVHALIMVVLITMEIGLVASGLLATLLRASLASMAMGLLLMTLSQLILPLTDGGVLGLFLFMAAMVFVGAATYVFILMLMRGEEVDMVKRVVVQRLRARDSE